MGTLLDRRPDNRRLRSSELSNASKLSRTTCSRRRVADYVVKLPTAAFVSTPLEGMHQRLPSSALVQPSCPHVSNRLPFPLNDRVNSGKAAQKARSQSTLGGGGAKEREKKKEDAV